MIKSYKISDEAFRFVVSESAHHFPNETGGILIGKVDHGKVIIQKATGPGPTAHHTPARFKRDGEFSQQVLEAAVQDSGGKYDYIGEWHSHPFNSEPSLVDTKAMKWIATNEKYAISEPVLLLCIAVGFHKWEVRCYSLVRKRLKLLKSIPHDRTEG